MRRSSVLLSALLGLVLLASPAWAELEHDSDVKTLHSATASAIPGNPLNVVGYNTATVQLTLTDATVTFKGSNHTTYFAIPCQNLTTSATATTATTTGLYACDVAGLSSFIADVTTFGSGTVAAVGRASTAALSSSTAISGGAGDASAANQTTMIGHLDGLEALGTTSNTNTGTTATQTTTTATQTTATAAGVGTTADAAATVGGTGSLNAKERLMTTLLDAIKTAVEILDNGDIGNVAHDSADSGAPVKTGGKAIAFGTNPTGVTAADRTDWYYNRAGIPFFLGGHPNSITRTALVVDADGAQTNAALVTVSAGTKIVVTRVSAKCDNDNTVSVNVKVGFGTATLPADAAGGANGILMHHPDIPPGGGSNEGNGAGILGVGADDEDVRLTMDDPVTGSCAITLSYFTIES